MTNRGVLAELTDDPRAEAMRRKSADSPPIEKPRLQSSPAVIWPMLAVAIACVLTDFSLGPMFDNLRTPGPKVIEAACFFALLGCTLAQGNLLAAWLVWSERPFLRRLVCHWLTAAVLYGAWVIGVMRTAPTEDGRMICETIGLVVPLASLAAQLPLWITRQWFGWRIIRAASKEQRPGERPLTIRGLMGATVLVAVALTLTRMAPVPAAQRGKEFSVALVFGFLVATGISTVGMLPAGRMLLGMQRFRAALGWSGLYATALISLVWIVRELMMRYALNGGPPILACAMLSGLMFGYATTLMVVGSVARAHGYRLVRGRRSGGVSLPVT